MENSRQSKQVNRGVPSKDRISALPESLMCEILSLLPTHHVVQTSILSKKWKDVWTSITSLNFDDELFTNYNERKIQRFEEFVNRVLILRKTPCLHKFRLHYVCMSDPLNVNKWVSAALNYDVRELILDVSIPESFEVPINHFTCKTLSFLSLNCIRGTMLNVPNSVCLPNLKYLYITEIDCANEEKIPKLLSCCPALEELSLRRNLFVKRKWNNRDIHLIISSPTLKRLTLNLFGRFKPDICQRILEIDAPLLQYLSLNDQLYHDYVIGNLSSLMKASISVYVSERSRGKNAYGDKLVQLFQTISHV